MCTASLQLVKLQTWYSRTCAKYQEVAPAIATATATATTTATATAITPLTLTPRVAVTSTLAPASSSTLITINLTIASQLEEVKEEECCQLKQLASNYYAAAADKVKADKTTSQLIATKQLQQFAQQPLDMIAAFAKHLAAAAVAAGSYTIKTFYKTELVSPRQDKQRLKQISQLFSLIFD